MILLTEGAIQLLESDEFHGYLSENLAYFKESVLKPYIANNIEQFIGESLEDTIKNVRVFTEVATEHFLEEVTMGTLAEKNLLESFDGDIDEAEARKLEEDADPISKYI